jgi:O-acetyl-ADP-ribose deacetylase (regulator of RNase III)
MSCTLSVRWNSTTFSCSLRVVFVKGPIGTGEELLAMCYRSLLEIVQNKEDIRTVALCGVSTGIFGFDLRVATNIALREVRTWMEAHSDTVDKVCLFFVVVVWR